MLQLHDSYNVLRFLLLSCKRIEAQEKTLYILYIFKLYNFITFISPFENLPIILLTYVWTIWADEFILKVCVTFKASSLTHPPATPPPSLLDEKWTVGSVHGYLRNTKLPTVDQILYNLVCVLMQASQVGKLKSFNSFTLKFSSSVPVPFKTPTLPLSYNEEKAKPNNQGLSTNPKQT